MIIRTADALGLDGAIFCKSCDVYNPKAIRSTMGAIFRIPVYRNVEKEELLEALNEAGLKSYAAVVNNAERDVKGLISVKAVRYLSETKETVLTVKRLWNARNG